MGGDGCNAGQIQQPDAPDETAGARSKRRCNRPAANQVRASDGRWGGVGVVIALGLIVVLAAGILTWRSAKALLISILLVAGSAVVWLVWAENEYRGIDYCPWGAHVKGHPAGHPVLIGLGLALGSGAIMAWTRWKRDSRASAAALGFSTGILAGVVILVAFLFGAGLRCTD
jgi:uncharacterized membrane protein